MAFPHDPRPVVGPSFHCSEGLPGEYNLKSGEPRMTTIVRMTDGWVEQCPDGVLLAASAWIPRVVFKPEPTTASEDLLRTGQPYLPITAASSVPPGPLGLRLATRSGSVRRPSRRTGPRHSARAGPGHPVRFGPGGRQRSGRPRADPTRKTGPAGTPSGPDRRDPLGTGSLSATRSVVDSAWPIPARSSSATRPEEASGCL